MMDQLEQKRWIGWNEGLSQCIKRSSHELEETSNKSQECKFV